MNQLPLQTRGYATRNLRHCLACGGEGHWVRFCPHMQSPNNQPAHQAGTSAGSTNPSSTFPVGRNFRFNLVDANGTAFHTEGLLAHSEDDGPLPDGIWGSEGNLTESWAKEDEAVGDTGATHMITGDLLRLTEVRLLARQIPISVATRGPRAFVTAKGTMFIKADDGSSIAVPNVYYLSQAQRTLISIPAITEAGGSWTGGDDMMVLKFRDGRQISSVYKDRKWTIPLVHPKNVPSRPLPMQFNTISPVHSYGFKGGAQPAASEALKWHCRFGHTSMRTIQKMVKHQLATGLPPGIDSTAFTCIDCLKSKSLRSVVLGPTGMKPEPLELIVSDVAGPFDASAQGARYMVVFRDVATSYAEAWCIAKRDQVPKVFANYVERMERATGRKVKVLRSDGAGKYTSP